MATGTAYSVSNRSLRLDGATIPEQVAERVDALTWQLGDWEDQAERWQVQYGYVPDYIAEGMQDAYAKLEQFAEYWGMDA